MEENFVIVMENFFKNFIISKTIISSSSFFYFILFLFFFAFTLKDLFYLNLLYSCQLSY